MTNTTDLDYLVAAPENVAPVIFRAQIIQTMAAHYQKRTGIDDDDAMGAAIATWETDWDADPAPRTIEQAIDEVDADLEHWGDDG
jgi:hypothetical protein